MLAIPALVPAVLAAAAVVGERQQGTLEPVLTTPIRSDELLLGKALAALMPSIVVAYLVFAFLLACLELFTPHVIATAVIQGSGVLAYLVFTPLVAGWSIWLGIAVSTRVSDIRTAQQFGAIASLPSIGVSTLIALTVIPATLGVAVGLGAVLLLLNGLGWRLAARLFDRERLITGTK
jgi:ABC-type Na+ efflux pump permease subunit